MLRLCWAWLLVQFIPFDRWRDSLGRAAEPSDRAPEPTVAKQLAADVEWAAARLPFSAKCLPQAMALSWMLRRRQLPHAVVIAVRPGQRHMPNGLHAWVEIAGDRILGDLPGQWIETLRLGE